MLKMGVSTRSEIKRKIFEQETRLAAWHSRIRLRLRYRVHLLDGGFASRDQLLGIGVQAGTHILVSGPYFSTPSHTLTW